MLPAFVPLYAYRGDTWTQDFRLLDAPGVPHDLTNATIAAWAHNAAVPQIILTVTKGSAPGTLTVALPSGAAAGLYSYDIELTEAGVVTTWVNGSLSIQQDVTNAP
jgi:hypothetical protein